jgi:hypothetical protein
MIVTVPRRLRHGMLKKPSSAADQEVVAIRVDIAGQRTADRVRAEAVWMLRMAIDDADGQRAHRTRPHASVGRADDVAAEIGIIGGHRSLVAAHPDVAARKAAAVVTASPTPPSGVLPG